MVPSTVIVNTPFVRVQYASGVYVPAIPESGNRNKARMLMINRSFFMGEILLISVGHCYSVCRSRFRGLSFYHFCKVFAIEKGHCTAAVTFP